MTTTLIAEQGLSAAETSELLSECHRVMNLNDSLANKNRQLVAENERLTREVERLKADLLSAFEAASREASCDALARLSHENERLKLAVAAKKGEPPLLRSKHFAPPPHSPRQARMDERYRMAKARLRPR